MGFAFAKMAINVLVDFLQIVIVDHPLIFLSIWSAVHFIVGFILWKKFKLDIKLVLLIVIGFEIIEPLFPNLFLGETAVDQLWDIVIALAGYFIAKKEKKWF